MAVVGLIILLSITLWLLSGKKKLGKNEFHRAVAGFKKTEKMDPNHGLMESHKIFIATLNTLYPKDKVNGATLVKRVAARLPNKQVIWKLHRMRNMAAHEPNFTVYQKTASQARHEFARALKALM